MRLFLETHKSVPYLECVHLFRLLGRVKKTCPAVGHVQTKSASATSQKKSCALVSAIVKKAVVPASTKRSFSKTQYYLVEPALALGFLGKQLEKALIQEDLRSANLLCLQKANMFECIKVTGSGLTFSEIGVNDKRDFGVGLMKQELD